MLKRVFREAGVPLNAVLVVIGWAAFFAGMAASAQYALLSVCLMAIARVLP